MENGKSGSGLFDDVNNSTASGQSETSLIAKAHALNDHTERSHGSTLGLADDVKVSNSRKSPCALKNLAAIELASHAEDGAKNELGSFAGNRSNHRRSGVTRRRLHWSLLNTFGRKNKVGAASRSLPLT
ncbi:MAG: hypothetical protein ACJAQT_001159 [Akkermansiaceae bacterium]|jgi:hypothetical protein